MLNNPIDIFRRGSWSGSGFNPFREMANLRWQADRMLDDLSSMAPVRSAMDMDTDVFVPSVDFDETEGYYLMSFDIPGIRKEDIKIEVRENEMTVSGERKEETTEKKATRYRSERYHGAFCRSFTLPSSIKADQVEARYADGVLKIAVPKSEATKAHQIKIGEGKSGILDRLTHRKESKDFGTKEPNAKETKQVELHS